MQLRTMLGGLLAAGVLSVGCGGAVADETNPGQSLGQTEQGLTPTCANGYTLYSDLECGPVCDGLAGNYRHYYCTNGTDTYDAGTGPVLWCGECY